MGFKTYLKKHQLSKSTVEMYNYHAMDFITFFGQR
jgi:hypothetical protein